VMPSIGFLDVLRRPDRISAWTEESDGELQHQGGGRWTGPGMELLTDTRGGQLAILLRAPGAAVKRARLRWQTGPAPTGARILGDAWERGYGDLEWRGLVPERVMPWYFLLHDGDRTHGCGVRTNPAALCWWQADGKGMSLWLDVRCGGAGVRLGDRELGAATIVVREGQAGESPFGAAQAFCRAMCDAPRLADHIVYGSNNWYYAYGRSSHEQILEDARIVVEHSPDGPNRPYMVIDSGWQVRNRWDGGNEHFPDMPGLAGAMADAGARPGVWYRPLAVPEDTDPGLLLSDVRLADTPFFTEPTLDPTVPEARERIGADTRRLVEWGYRLLKHDFSTIDLFGHYGPQLGSVLTKDGWALHDRSITTAEAVRQLHADIRQAAGDAVVIGCNTMGHLGAGLFELQRTGDDTSGQEWDRTRRMGVNTLAFRMPQHAAFFAADADCVGLTNAVPWELNRQWLELLAASGTPLFVSAAPDALGPEQRAALKDAFALASQPLVPGEPLDWMDTTCPRRWRLNEEVREFDWFGSEGAVPQ
jgi:alpha-galactosidase